MRFEFTVMNSPRAFRPATSIAVRRAQMSSSGNGRESAHFCCFCEWKAECFERPREPLGERVEAFYLMCNTLIDPSQRKNVILMICFLLLNRSRRHSRAVKRIPGGDVGAW